MPRSTLSGTLFVVATPIGNLHDMVPRAIETLQSVTLIAAEDTRHSGRLMAHFAIETPMVAYHDHSDERRPEPLLSHLQTGEYLVLISNADSTLVIAPVPR